MGKKGFMTEEASDEYYKYLAFSPDGHLYGEYHTKSEANASMSRMGVYDGTIYTREEFNNDLIPFNNVSK